MQSEAEDTPDSTDAPAPKSRECGVSMFCFKDRKNSSKLKISIKTTIL